ncbi:UDP-N-acetylmuramoyl-L-alanine--D-glutamate ligase [Christensenellaceae bacterium OttesenSCG-928-K19]|nr:UDP-N-acetylmuramoyl-L-alanine--D-glutamate ligase [Christensenellaceae bacterium OttesenSCG-928-K19]
MDYKDKKVLVVGMARSGAAATKLLNDLGADVTIYDLKTKEQLPEDVCAILEGLHYHDMLGNDPLDIIEQMDVLVLSPGVPLGLPFIQKAYELGKKVIAEIELGYSASKADFIAITGTNGKTTTTSLVGEIFKNAGIKTYVLGNIGVPITQEALHTKPGDVVVAETAALQLDTIDEYKPKGSAILNITEDHMDRYGKMENYIAAKAKIFKNQTPGDYCVLNYDNEIVRNLADQIKAKVFWFSTQHKLDEGTYVKNGDIVFAHAGKETKILPANELNIPGRHNLENALTATAIACVYGIKPEVVAHTLQTFKGVEHRIEFVSEVNGVTFINDSKGTNPDATLNAVNAMEKPTILILGGYDKQSDFRALFEGFTPYIKAVVVLGATANKIIRSAQDAGYENYIRATGFEDAVLKAYSMAGEGEVVLLSPACASWDMFKDFEERGDEFKRIVRGL